MSLRHAFEAEHLRREQDRIAREAEERARQEADHARAQTLHDLIAADPVFLAEKGLHLELTRYTVVLDHDHYRLRAYFEDGQVNVTSADKRTATTATAAPRKQEIVDSVDAALAVLA
jgi:hypothetical protein